MYCLHLLSSVVNIANYIANWQIRWSEWERSPPMLAFADPRSSHWRIWEEDIPFTKVPLLSPHCWFVNTGANEILHSRPAFIRGLVIFDCFFIFVSFFLILTLNYYCLLYINLFWNDSSFHKHVNYVSIRDKWIYDKICCLFD